MLILPETKCAACKRRIPFTRVSEISSLMGSSNWPCISITLEANWFPSVSHLYNWAFANHLKMHVRERDDSVKEIHFSFILLVIHTTEYVIVQTIKEMYFLTSLASQKTHYLQCGFFLQDMIQARFHWKITRFGEIMVLSNSLQAYI